MFAGKKQLLAASIRLSPLYRLNRLTFELQFLCMWVMTIAHLGLKVKVMGQGQMWSAYGCSNVVGLTSILDRGQFYYLVIDSRFDVPAVFDRVMRATPRHRSWSLAFTSSPVTLSITFTTDSHYCCPCCSWRSSKHTHSSVTLTIKLRRDAKL